MVYLQSNLEFVGIQSIVIYKMFGYVYKTTNLINGKIYVGLKRSSVFMPTYLGSGGCKVHGKQSGLLAAIEKYGRKNFKVEIIEWCETNEQLCEREWYWKQKLNVFDPNIGYNIYKGKEGPGLSEQQRRRWENPDKYKEIYLKRTQRLKEKYNGSCISEETREKIRQNSKNIVRKPCSEETKRKISISNKGKARVGRSLTEEQKRHLSEVRKGKPNYKRRGIKYTEEQKKHVSEGRRGQRWWSKGNETKLCKECPGEGWVIGRFNQRGRIPWNKKIK